MERGHRAAGVGAQHRMGHRAGMSISSIAETGEKNGVASKIALGQTSKATNEAVRTATGKQEM